MSIDFVALCFFVADFRGPKQQIVLFFGTHAVVVSDIAQ
jgi:hypothetical protein